MILVKSGDRGPQVLQLQQNLNGHPSKLERLRPDSIFGPKTQARVIEFQRNNGLKPDGIVGDATNAKLLRRAAPRPVDVAATMNQMAANLDAAERTAFLAAARPLVGDRSLLANAVAVEAILILLVLMFFVAVLASSPSKAKQEQAKELDREIARLREKLRSNPLKAAEVSEEAFRSAKKQGESVAKQAESAREKCLGRLTPDQFARKSRECAKLLAALTTAIQSLLQKLDTPLGGGIDMDSLTKGIVFSSGALIAAMRALGNCLGCDDLFI